MMAYFVHLAGLECVIAVCVNLHTLHVHILNGLMHHVRSSVYDDFQVAMRQGKYHISITCEHDLGLESRFVNFRQDVTFLDCCSEKMCLERIFTIELKGT
jgi:hypothetical protein